MLLLRNWYFVQASPNDERARNIDFDDDLMGQLIRFVSSHEVGHTLGLRHNFGSSSTVPVEKLRDNNWLTKNGHTPSIMDYARFNYVAQPEDKISPENLMPRIGDYDNWAIEWGYRRFYDLPSEDKEKPFLNKWVISNLKNDRLWFGTESNPFDPRSQSEQVGDDAMIASTYGVKNLKKIVDNLEKWTAKPNEDFSNLDMMYDQVLGQYKRYLGHVSKYIGGQMETPKKIEQKGPVYEVVAKSEQKRALKFLEENVFTTPDWILPIDIFNKTGKTPIAVVEGIQNGVLDRILSAPVLNKMYSSQLMDNKAYPLVEYLGDVQQSIFNNGKPDIYQRNLQRNYVGSLLKLVNKNVALADNSDVSALVRGNLMELMNMLKNKSTEDTVTKYHYQDLVYRIDSTFKADK